jgi:hypothetical protein
VLVALIDEARNDVNRFRRSVETWFDLTMDRVSGWYKRQSQIALAVIAAVMTLLFNADLLQVGRALWNDDSVRAAVVAQAQRSVEEGTATPDVGNGVSEAAETLSDQVADVRSLELPLGWSTNPEDPRWFDSLGGAIGKVFGLLATMLALTLGLRSGSTSLGVSLVSAPPASPSGRPRRKALTGDGLPAPGEPRASSSAGAVSRRARALGPLLVAGESAR